jgi:CRP/FNR family transcriptional regulator, cyclic AMP receptor protein
MSNGFENPPKLWYLKQIHLFSGLSEADLQELEQLARMFTVKKREIIYLPGDPAHTVYLLKKGRVKFVRTGQGGKEFTVEILQPGEIFGDMDQSEQSVRTMRVEARDDAVLCRLRREDFEHYLSRHPDLIVSLYEMIRRRFRKFQSCVEDLAQRSVSARLAHLLLDLAQVEGVPHGQQVHIRVQLTHQEMADLIGCSRETVSTTIGQFRAQGVIGLEAQTVTILNPEALSRLVS